LPLFWIIILLAVVLAAFPLFNMYRLSQLDQEISSLQDSVLNDPNYPLLSQVSSTRAVVNEARGRLTTARQMDVALKTMDWLNEDFLLVLTGYVPRDVEITSIGVSPSGAVQMSGRATNRVAIAELEFNYRNTGRFTDLFIGNISRDGGTADIYSFTLTMQTKGVGSSAAN
jgi:hypothetical protein